MDAESYFICNGCGIRITPLTSMLWFVKANGSGTAYFSEAFNVRTRSVFQLPSSNYVVVGEECRVCREYLGFQILSTGPNIILNGIYQPQPGTHCFAIDGSLILD